MHSGSRNYSLFLLWQALAKYWYPRHYQTSVCLFVVAFSSSVGDPLSLRGTLYAAATSRVAWRRSFIVSVTGQRYSEGCRSIRFPQVRSCCWAERKGGASLVPASGAGHLLLSRWELLWRLQRWVRTSLANGLAHGRGGASSTIVKEGPPAGQASTELSCRCWWLLAVSAPNFTMKNLPTPFACLVYSWQVGLCSSFFFSFDPHSAMPALIKYSSCSHLY